MASDSFGIPFRPCRLANSPSATGAPSTSELSSQCAMTGMFSDAASFMASFIICALCTPTPSSVKPIAPAAFSAAKSVSSLPSSLFVIAA
ncbi:hypothetical protein D1872_242690 [compost metagenome]